MNRFLFLRFGLLLFAFIKIHFDVHMVKSFVFFLILAFFRKRVGHQQAEIGFVHFFGVDDAGDLPVAEHHDLIAEFQHHIEVFPDEKDAHAAFFLLVEGIVDHIRRVDIETADGISRNDHRGIGVDFTAEENFLHIAAGKLAHRRFRARSNDFQIVNDLLRRFSRFFAVHQRPFGVVVVFEHHIIGDAQGSGETHAQTVFGNKAHADAAFDDFLGRIPFNMLAFI